MRSNIPVCPSEDVDAAWHLHLTYTRSYWKRFCGEVLGQPLHHEPTRGGPSEADKHLRMYEATLAAYREAFGEAPPSDIWPSAKVRFGDDLRQRMVNTSRNWVIPKQAVKRSLQVAATFAAVAIFVPGCEGGFNPFALKGADFLVFLIPMMIAAICLGRVIRSALLNPGPRPEDKTAVLTWEQAAYLSGGYARLTTAAIARLAEAKIVRVVDDRLESGKVIPPAGTAIENVIITHLPISKHQLPAIEKMVEVRFGETAAKLEARGITLAKPQQTVVVMGSLLPLAGVMLFLAVPRLFAGLSAGKPVAYLVATAIIGGIIGTIVCLSGSKLRSRRASYILEQLRKRNVTAKTDAGLAVALFGTAILAGSSVAYLNNWYPRQSTNSDSGSGCGTSSDSGGDGGGGDGGGGGCGGCGGGGGD